jgi:tRNA A-37 threonylcarbamoyl transferase component Bud32
MTVGQAFQPDAALGVRLESLTYEVRSLTGRNMLETTIETGGDPVDELAEEFARRIRGGEKPTVEEYVERYPQLADEIRDVLPAVLLLEQHKPSGGPLDVHRGDIPPARVGAYRIIREIGRGGMGIVYEAEEEALGRHAAIKVLPKHRMADPLLQARFRRESRAAARLHHNHIVPVFSVGETDEYCYYVMQLIQGQGLDRLIATAIDFPQASLTERRAAQIGFEVADALAYAHSQGVLHRDIKPSNLLLDAAGTTWVTDFGVAKLIEEENLTRSGEFVGSLRYMAPEQFSGQSDVRGDIYSLGVTLYELLTLRPAYPASAPQPGVEDPPPPQPRALNPYIPRDLETIVLKAMDRRSEHRYQTAKELARDLRQFLDDRPIEARRSSLFERAWRWCRGNPAHAATIGLVVLLTMALVAVGGVAYKQQTAIKHAALMVQAAETGQNAETEKTLALSLESLRLLYTRQNAPRQPGADKSPPETNPPPAEPLSREERKFLEDFLLTYEPIVHAADKYPGLAAQAADANHRIGDLSWRLGRIQDAVAAYQLAIDQYARSALDASAEPIRIKLARLSEENLGSP